MYQRRLSRSSYRSLVGRTATNAIHCQRHASDLRTSLEMTRLHRIQTDAAACRERKWNGQLTQLDTDDCYNVTTAQSASRLPESVGDRGDLRSPGRA